MLQVNKDYCALFIVQAGNATCIFINLLYIYWILFYMF